MSVFLRSAGALGLSCAAITLAPRASAAPTARLVYVRSQGAESCPGEGTLRDAVAARLGYDPFSTWATDTLFVEITVEPGVYVSRIKLVGGDNIIRGARDLRLRGSDCLEVVPTLALTVSLAIDPLYFSREGPPTDLPPGEHKVIATEPQPREKSPPAPPDSPQADRPPAPRGDGRGGGLPREPVNYRLTFGALGNLGAAPSPNLGGLVGLEVRRGSLRALLEARADVPASTDVPLGRVVSSLLVGTIAPCFTFAAPTFACLPISAGLLRATADDVTESRVRTAFFASAGLRLGVDVSLGGSWVMQPTIEASFTPTQTILEINGRAAYTHPPVMGNLGLRIGAWP